MIWRWKPSWKTAAHCFSGLLTMTYNHKRFSEPHWLQLFENSCFFSAQQVFYGMLSWHTIFHTAFYQSFSRTGWYLWKLSKVKAPALDPDKTLCFIFSYPSRKVLPLQWESKSQGLKYSPTSSIHKEPRFFTFLQDTETLDAVRQTQESFPIALTGTQPWPTCVHINKITDSSKGSKLVSCTD